MAFRDLRQAVTRLRAEGRLRTVSEPVSPVHEMAACLSLTPDEAVWFSRVEGFAGRAVGNVVCCRAVLAWALGVDEPDLAGALAARLGEPLAPRPVRKAPALEATEPTARVDRVLPVLTHYAGDSGPFLTAGLVSAVDPDTGVAARGVHRMEVRGEDRLGVALVNPPLSELCRRARERRETLPVAVTLGLEPATFLAGALKGAAGVDKLALAGALRGEPVEVVSAPLTGIPIPARAEFVLEGEIDPADERPDGPLGEISGYSLAFPSTPTLRVRRIHRREDAVYHALLPTGPDGDTLLAVVAEASVLPHARALFPFARDFHFVPTTFGSSVVVRTDRVPREQVRCLLLHLLSLGMIKKAVAVAADVDPSAPAEVEWSLATRCQPDRDALVVSDLKGQPIDPSGAEAGRTSKLAIDATGYGLGAASPRALVAADALLRAETLLHRR